MRKERLAAIEKVRSGLLPAEADLDSAIASGAMLAYALITARTEARLPIMIGQEAFDEIADGNRLMAQARACYARAHKSLRATPAQMGLPEVSWGDTQPCPSSATVDEPLRIVG